MFTLPLPLMNISPQTDHKLEPIEELAIPKERVRSQTISSSRRRINRDSTIVLNSNRVQKYATQLIHQQGKDEHDSNNMEGSLGWSASHSDEEKNLSVDDRISSTTTSLILPADSGYKLSSINNYYYEASILSNNKISEICQTELYLKSIRLIQKWWLSARQRIRYNKYTQGGRWSKKLADSVFAMFLGYRVRCLLKQAVLKKTRNAQLDIAQVLSDVLTKSQEQKKIGDLSTFSATDKSLAQSLIKQLLVEKEKLHNLVFSNSTWRTFPAPGYWDLVGAFRNSQIAGRNGVPQPARNSPNTYTFTTPPRAGKIAISSQPRQAIINTPPHCNNLGPDLPASERFRGSNVALAQSELSYTDLSSKKEDLADSMAMNRSKGLSGKVKRRAPKSLKDILADKEKVGRSQQVLSRVSSEERNLAPIVPATEIDTVIDGLLLSPVRAVESHQDSGKKAARAVLSTGAAHVEEKTAAAGPTVSPISMRKRITNKPSIQLDIISADRLMPAKKGSSGREGGAGPVPDRKPCLKVSLSLPVVNAATAEDLFSFRSQGQGYVPKNTDPPSSSQLKKMYQCSKDFETITLNPRWGSTFNINLPCSKQILQLLLHANRTILGRLPVSADEMLSERDYSLICRALLNWWSFGIINVEVLDGERFNEEIFIGHVNLMLSGFMIGVKNQNELEMKGAYQLCKLLPAQRVSGSIKIHTYLHVPDIIFLSDIFRSIGSNNAISDLAARKADDNDLETSNVMDGSMDLLDISNSSEGNEPVAKQGYETNRNSRSKQSIFSSRSEDSCVVVHRENTHTSTWSIHHASKRTPDKETAESKPPRESIVFDGSISRRMFIQDITKQLEGLSAVQNSTDDFLMLESFQRQLRDREKERERERRRVSRFGNQSSALMEDETRERRQSAATTDDTTVVASSPRRSLSADAVSRAVHRHSSVDVADEGSARSARFMGTRGDEYRAKREAAMQQRPKVVSANQLEDCDVPEMQDSDVGGPEAPFQVVEAESGKGFATMSAHTSNLSYSQRFKVEDGADASSDESDSEVVINTSKLQKSRHRKYAISNRLRRGSGGVMPLTLLKLKDRNSNTSAAPETAQDELNMNRTFQRNMLNQTSEHPAPVMTEFKVTDSISVHTANPQDAEVFSSGNTSRLSREDSRVTMDADVSSSTIMNISSISNSSGTSAESTNVISSSVPLSSTLAGSMKSNTARAILKEFLGNKQAPRPADGSQVQHSVNTQQSSHGEVRTRKRNHIRKALLELSSLEL